MGGSNEALILVVEDDPAVRNLVATALEVNGYQHKEVTHATAALLELTSDPNIALVLLDLGLPDRDGVEVIETLRGWSQTPVIVLSARQEDADKIAALDAGADDYLTKPFSVNELLARVRVALRRSAQGSAGAQPSVTTYENGPLTIDYEAGIARIQGEEVHLTPMEYKLLVLLSRNTGKVLTHNYILKEVWGSALASDLPSLRVFMATLRKKLEAKAPGAALIQTHVGIGYRMVRAEDSL